MYVIIVYDVNVDRVAKVLKYLRRHLHWVQNSVFEGQVTPAQLAEIKSGLKKRLKIEEDSVYFYIARDQKLVNKELLGKAPANDDTFI